MFNSTINRILIALLLIGPISVSAADLTVAQQVGKLKVGRKIKVELTSGEKLKGRMGPAAADQFTLEPRGKTQGTARVVLFNDARSVKADGMNKKQKWAIFAVVWVVLGIVANTQT